MPNTVNDPFQLIYRIAVDTMRFIEQIPEDQLGKAFLAARLANIAFYICAAAYGISISAAKHEHYSLAAIASNASLLLGVLVSIVFSFYLRLGVVRSLIVGVVAYAVPAIALIGLLAVVFPKATSHKISMFGKITRN